jgi:hypothetical protein
MEKYIEIREPMISAEAVLKRWPGVLESELAYIIDNSLSLDFSEVLPTAYRVHKVLNDGNGGIIVECEICGKRGNYYVDYQSNDYDFTGIAFTLDDIVNYEQKNPKVFYKVVESLDDAWSNE